jgi:hypothetical protein
MNFGYVADFARPDDLAGHSRRIMRVPLFAHYAASAESIHFHELVHSVRTLVHKSMMKW